MPSVSPGFVAFTRLGFAARGILYLLVGYLALRLGRAADAEGALDYLRSGAGRAILAAMAAGFAAYAAWRLIDAWLDLEGKGNDAKGLFTRVGHAGSGLIHAGLAFKTATLALGGRSQGSSSDAAESSAASAMALPGGDALMLAAAGVLLAVSLVQINHAMRLKFRRHLAAEAARRAWVVVAGAAGYAARGIVFAVVAYLLVRASIDHSPSAAAGPGEALRTLPRTLQSAIAAGLGLFGLYCLVEARWRVIRDPQVKQRVERIIAAK